MGGNTMEKGHKNRYLKLYNVPIWLMVTFLLVLEVSILINIKLIFFQQSQELKNIPFWGQIVECDAGRIEVKGLARNVEGLQETYQIFYSDQIKIVDENNQDIAFQDLQTGMYVYVRLWVEGIDFQNMDTLTFVTRIECSETKEGL